MDDLAAKLSEILGSEEGMKQVEEMAQKLGVNLGNAPPPPPSSPLPDGIDLQAILGLMQQFNTQDQSTALLDALKPYLRPERVQRVEAAKKMLRLMQLMPLLQQMGDTQ